MKPEKLWVPRRVISEANGSFVALDVIHEGRTVSVRWRRVAGQPSGARMVYWLDARTVAGLGAVIYNRQAPEAFESLTLRRPEATRVPNFPADEA